MVKEMTAKDKLQQVFDDYSLFSKNFIYITDNENAVVPFELNDAQLEIEGLAKKNRFVIVGKARQSGVSTYVLGRALWRALTKPNENILIVSYKGDSAKALFDKLKSMNDFIPRERFKGVFPVTKRDNRGELKFSNGSSISSVTAGTKSIGRGSTYTYIHLSEFAFYGNQESQLLSVEQSLAKGSESQLTIETTSNGVGNHFFKLYTAAMKGDSKYVPVFIPWYHKLYKKQFKYDHSQAMEWHKANNKGKRLSQEDLEEDEIPLFEAGANLNMIAWKRWKILDMESENQFFQEYPANPMQSFISTGKSVFNQSMVLKRMGNLMPPIERKDVVNECETLPEYLIPYIGKGLNIFLLPVAGARYYGGSDVSSGSGGDSSTLALYDADGQMVLSFDSNKTPVYLFSEILNDIGRLYNYAFICVERNSYGLPVLERLRREYNYLNLYKQKIFDERGQKKLQLGYTTTAKTKAIFVSDFKEQFEKNLINIDCSATLSQMQMFVETEGRMGNKGAFHDDLVIASCLAIQSIKTNKWYV
ncbi:MAG TPA: terminase family protein [Sporosarcina psychrophila]|uniref:Terminase family protein n=1 Tax=Sporosarcina psychrophila TaxID=1476 RepID=A0A921KDJ9_SPOPS|nr:terminase family protein [Sporosarcina psychrophila]